MASDLISRSAVLAEYDRVHVGKPGGARKLIAEAQAVDAVELVRCKDCRLRTESRSMLLHCSLTGIQTDDDDFCSYGCRAKMDGGKQDA